MAHPSVSRMPPEKLAREISRRFSRHVRFGDGDEAYDFNVKVGRVNVPDMARARMSEQEINDRVELEMRERLWLFGQDLVARFPWIEEWRQEGRSGGWLTLVTHEPALGYTGHSVRNVREARRRLRDLMEIEDMVDAGKDGLEKDLASPEWWGVAPHDWSPRKGRAT